jgi:hypothetical protein
LPGDVPKPEFVADLYHRKKVWTGDLVSLLSLKVGERHGLTGMDTTRLGKNFGYMIRSLSKLPKTGGLMQRKLFLSITLNVMTTVEPGVLASGCRKLKRSHKTECFATRRHRLSYTHSFKIN